MKSKLLQSGEERLIVLALEPGEELVSVLLEFARREKLYASRLSAVGAASSAVLGYFHRESKQYHRNPIDEQVEVASLTGTIALHEGKPKLHAHCVLGREDGTAVAGHVLELHVWPTLEIVIADSSDTLQRQQDAATGLALLVP